MSALHPVRLPLPPPGPTAPTPQESVKPLFEQRQADGSHAMSAMGAMITGGWVV